MLILHWHGWTCTSVNQPIQVDLKMTKIFSLVDISVHQLHNYSLEKKLDVVMFPFKTLWSYTSSNSDVFSDKSTSQVPLVAACNRSANQASGVVCWVAVIGGFWSGSAPQSFFRTNCGPLKLWYCLCCVIYCWEIDLFVARWSWLMKNG